MKISHTLIHKGIIFGIPEGTKVPEKPTLQSMTCSEDCKGECGDVCPVIQNARMDNEAEMSRYNTDIQALLSVAIQWEDQDKIHELVQKYRVDSGLIMTRLNPPDGIYPLKGVEAKQVYKAWTPGNIWNDITEKDYKALNAIRQHVTTCLRLIPQHNSEQKKDLCHDCNGSGTVGVGINDICDSCKGTGVEGTEVSEPGPKRNAVSEMLINNLSSGVNESRDPRTICPLSDTELLQACHKAITDMCQKQRWQMSVPPDMSHDSDMLLSELCTRFERVSGGAKTPDLLYEKLKKCIIEGNVTYNAGTGRYSVGAQEWEELHDTIKSLKLTGGSVPTPDWPEEVKKEWLDPKFDVYDKAEAIENGLIEYFGERSEEVKVRLFPILKEYLDDELTSAELCSKLILAWNPTPAGYPEWYTVERLRESSDHYDYNGIEWWRIVKKTTIGKLDDDDGQYVFCGADELCRLEEQDAAEKLCRFLNDIDY